MAKPNLLLLGATGFIGGTILNQLVENADYSITLLVRSDDKASKLKDLDLGLNPVIGSTEDLKLLEELASETDVVIQSARTHHPNILGAILAGLRKRHSKTRTAPRLFYISGTALLSDEANGLHSDQKPISDLDPAVMYDPPHPVINFFKFVAIDLAKADDDGYVKSYIIGPPLVYGEPDNRFTKAGISTSHSRIWPSYFGPFLEKGRAGYIGKGANLAGAVHVEDLANLFILILKQENTAGHGKNGFYFTSPIEISMKELALPVAEAFVALGKSTDPTPSAFTEEEIKEFLKPPYDSLLGSNARSVGERSASLGWKSKYTTKQSLLEEAKAEILRLGKESGN